LTDHVLDRIRHDSAHDALTPANAHPSRLVPIPWPEGRGPAPIPDALRNYGSDTPLPRVDAVVVTWTAAEWRALTDVLAPGEAWQDYSHGFSAYEPMLTDRSPARAAKTLGRYCVVRGNGRTVLLLHSDLHLATDGDPTPLVPFWKQVIAETGCERLVTTGTAGGIGADKRLGDVVVSSYCQFDCQETFAAATWAHQSYPCTAAPDLNGVTYAPMLAANADQLPAGAPAQLYLEPVVTTDFFAYDTSTDEYRLQGITRSGAVEMDDATLGLAISELLSAALPAPLWCAVRNVSDPQADVARYRDEEDTRRGMGDIYRRFGYWTTVNSAIVSWMAATSYGIGG